MDDETAMAKDTAPDKPGAPKSRDRKKKGPPVQPQELAAAVKAAGTMVAVAAVKQARGIFDEILDFIEEGAAKKPSKRKKS